MVDFEAPIGSISPEDLEEFEGRIGGLEEGLPLGSIETGDWEELTGELAPWERPTGKAVEPIPPEEAEFAAAHPNIYAAGKIFWDFWNPLRRVAAPTPEESAKVGRWVVGVAPFAKYTLPEQREKFLGLSQQEQTRALLCDTLETAILFPKGIPSFFKGVGKIVAPLAKGVRRLKPVFKFAPIEDVILKETRPFFGELEATKILKGKKFSDDEILAILDDDLLGLWRRKMSRGEVVTSSFRKEIYWEGGVPKLGRKLEEMLVPEMLRSRHYRKEWKRILGKHLGKDYHPKLGEKVFAEQVRKTLGEDMVGKVTLANASDHYMVNFVKHLFKHPKVIKTAVTAGDYEKIIFDCVSPVRVVFGIWEKAHQAYSKIHQVISPAKATANEYVFEKSLTLMQMFKERGLGTWSAKAAGALKFRPAFSPEDAKKVYEIGVALDGLAAAGRRTPMLRERLAKEAKALREGLTETQRKLLKTQQDFFDHLYAEHVLIKIPQLFEKVGLTQAGRGGVDNLSSSIGLFLGNLFSKTEAISYKGRLEGIKGLLEKIRGTLLPKEGKHPWFVVEGKELEKVLGKLNIDLTMPPSPGKEGNFVGYLENYTARIREGGADKAARWDNALVGEMHSFYTKKRKETFGFGLVEDFGSMIEGRIRAGANELFLYPKIEEGVAHARKLPINVKEYTEHYIARMLGQQSYMDSKLASFLEKTVGKLGGKEFWTEKRVATLGRRLNDAAIVGGLALKPFAVMRDMFQPLLTVPADLGGLKGFYHLLRGYHAAFTRPDIRKYIRDIGAITEFAPELYLQQRILPWGRAARWEQVRDVGLWMYGFSDRSSRYVTGGAAFQKWDDALLKIGKEKILGNEVGLQAFSKKVGLRGRYPHIRDWTEDLLRKGKFVEAKAFYVDDVISDCQFLYRVTEAAIISQKYGVIGKTGFLFQSWWANYGTLLEKWMRVGDSGTEKANRMFTWMLSSAITAQLMEPLWGRETALRSTFLGPFPTTLNKYILPPAWAPIYEFANLIGHGIGFKVFGGEPEKLVENAKALFRSFVIFAPGGLQFQQMAKGVAKEGWGGLAKSIIRYQQAKDYRPLWGIGQRSVWEEGR